LNFRRNTDVNIKLFYAVLTVLFSRSIYFTQILTNASHTTTTATKMQNASTIRDPFLARAMLGTLETAKVVKVCDLLEMT